MSTQSSASQCKQIAEFNNAGVSALATGNTTVALRSFKAALVIMSNSAANADLDHESKDCVSPGAEVAGLEDAYFFVCNRALLFNAASDSDFTLTNACLLFNMALAFHQRGVTGGGASQYLKAVRLYDMAAQMILEARPKSGALAMAALNNQAHIYYSVGEYARSEERLERVQECAVLVSTDIASEPVPQEDMNEIWLNIAIVEPPRMAPSA